MLLVELAGLVSGPQWPWPAYCTMDAPSFGPHRYATSNTMSYPAYVDGKPPVITLKEYDTAPWALTTCVDRRDGAFVVVVMEDPNKVVASVDPKDSPILDSIFKSAHKDFSTQLENKNVQSK